MITIYSISFQEQILMLPKISIKQMKLQTGIELFDTNTYIILKNVHSQQPGQQIIQSK